MFEPRRFSTVLNKLREAEIEFVLVGGVAAVLHGAPIQTYDVDVVHSRAPANIDRLLRFLQEVEAVFRIQPERRLRPNKSHLAGERHLNLVTRYGPIDVLCTIGDHLGFDDLLPHSEVMRVSEGLNVRVLNLDKLIAIKEQLGSPKDLAVLPILRQTLRERERAKG